PPQSKEEFDAALANPTKDNLSMLLSDRSWENSTINYDRPKSHWFYYHYEVGADGKLQLIDPEVNTNLPDDERYRQRGNNSRNDGYFMFTVKAEYTIKVTKQRVVTFNKVYNPRFRARKR